MSANSKGQFILPSGTLVTLARKKSAQPWYIRALSSRPIAGPFRTTGDALSWLNEIGAKRPG